VTSRQVLHENILSLSILQAINYIAPLITLPYLVRVLQPPQFGLLSFAQGVVLYFDFFTDFGFNFSATKSIAACRNSPRSVSRIFWSTMFAKALLMCASGIALALLVAAIPKLRETPSLFAVNGFYLLGTALFPAWLFQGLEKMKFAVGALGIARLLTAGALVLLVRHPGDYVLAGAIQASVELIASIFVVPVVFKWVKVSWYRPSLSDITDCLKQAWPVFLSNSSLFLSLSSTTVILGSVAGKTEVGYYSAADKLIKASIAALSPVSQALYPHVAAARCRSSLSALQLIRKSFAVMVTLSLLISAGTALLAHPFCHLFFGRSFAHSAVVLECLSPLPVLFALIAVLGTQTMLIFDMEAALTKIMLAGAVVGIPVTVLLSNALGAVGAALSSVALATVIVAGLFVVLYSKGLHVWKYPGAQPLPLTPLSPTETE